VLPTKYEFVINLKTAKVLGSLFRARYTRPPPSWWIARVRCTGTRT